MNPRKKRKRPVIVVDLTRPGPTELPNELFDEMFAAGKPIPGPVEFIETPRTPENERLAQEFSIELRNELYDEVVAAGEPVPGSVEFVETPRPPEYRDVGPDNPTPPSEPR